LDEHEQIIGACERSVERLAEALPGAEIGCLLRVGDALRHVAHAGRLRLIYEVAREKGGVVWRAAERGEIQLVENVRGDPDYLASDERVRSEIAAPVTAGGSVVAVLDVEFPERVYGDDEAASVATEAQRLARELEPYVS
jgi:putative methionine-R-sulfoxide reductase with GAF domain